MFEVVIAIAAIYGAATLVSDYEGPFKLFHKARRKLRVLRCTVCASVWIGIPIALMIGLTLPEYLAALGGVILIERWISL